MKSDLFCSPDINSLEQGNLTVKVTEKNINVNNFNPTLPESEDSL